MQTKDGLHQRGSSRTHQTIYAKDFSFVMFVALTLPLLIGGAVATALTGVNLGELRERARRRAAEET